MANKKRLKENKLRKGMLPMLLLMLSVAILRPSTCFSGGKDKDVAVRIAILQNVENVQLKARDDYTLYDAESGRELDSGRRLLSTEVKAMPNSIQFGAITYSLKKLMLKSKKPITVLVGKRTRKYRGKITIVLTKDNKLLVVNTLGLEDYIRGVLYHEVSHRWPLEAIKAQAVAARSYAIYRAASGKKRDFDVSSDIYSQVYGGRESERYRTNLAVKRTKNEVLTFDGKILPTYYHATCAGRTEDVQEVWKEDLFALKGVVCPFCSHAPHFSWKKNIQLKRIQEALNKRRHDIDLIKKIQVKSRNNSGRIRTLMITSRTGKKLEISGKDFRDIIGPNTIRSNNYRINMKGYYVDFVGRGWGHGVGMCQWGAMEMSRQRHNYKEILTYYYPGAKVQKTSTLPISQDKN